MGNLYSYATGTPPAEPTPEQTPKLTHKASEQYTPNYLGQNILICGKSGSGKTTLVKHIIKQLDSQVDEICIYGDFRHEHNNGNYIQAPDLNQINFDDETKRVLII